MVGPSPSEARAKYRHAASGYDRLALLTRGLRRRAVERLELRPGEVVIDVACGTGLSFELLEDEVGPSGRLIGVDVSPDMLALAHARVAAHGWRNVTLIEAAIEQARLPEPADAALFMLTHDVMQSTQALRHLLEQLKPGARIAVLGAKRAPAWALPVNLYLRYAARRYITAREGFGRPWSTLEQLVPRLEVRSLLLGGVYLASGTLEGVLPPTPPAA
jgi:ubiquinone/menaquinone biosynthesis C-methylase UbiE